VISGNTWPKAKGKDTSLSKTDTEIRRDGYQKGFDTLVVHSVNDES